MKPFFEYSPKPALEPQPGCQWADTMVLNPAIVQDPLNQDLHMLFRATGPGSAHKMPASKCDPYPIFLGYAVSHDLGKTWEADFSRPALAPSLKYGIDEIFIRDDRGEIVVNYSNGCIEDPRIFEVEGQWFVSVACRMFPPGPYWQNQKVLNTRFENIPLWAQNEDNPFGKAASRNDTTTVLYKLDLDQLRARNYEKAFQYSCPLTDPSVDDNRDVFLFPRKMPIDGRLQYVLLHRPHNPEHFSAGKGHSKPSIMLACADEIRELSGPLATHRFLAEGIFDWEGERIGASWAPLSLGSGEWLLANHGKTWPGFGYTQSFMILKEVANDFPQIIHRCPDRLMYASQPWELPDKFPCPCLFSTGGIVVDGTLVISYGAADQKVGIAWGNLDQLVSHLRKFDEKGGRY